MVISALCMTCMHAVIRHLSKDLHAFEIVFFRYAFGIVFMLPWLARQNRDRLKMTQPRLYVLRVAVTFVATASFFAALGMIPLGDATAALFTRPLFAACIAILFLGEVVTAQRWMALGTGLIGVLIMIRPGFEEINVGIFLALFGTAVAAANASIIRTQTRHDSPDTVTFYAAAMLTVISLIPAAVVWRWPGAEALALLALMGCIGTLGQRALARSFQAGDVSLVLPFDYSRLIFAAIIGFIVFGEFPVIWTWIGGTVIFAATVLLARAESRGAAREAGR